MLTAKELVPSLDLEDTPLVRRRTWLGLSPRAERLIDPCYPTPVRTSGANPDKCIGTGGPLPPPPALCPADDIQTEGRGRGRRILREAGSSAARFPQYSPEPLMLEETTPDDQHPAESNP